MSKRKMDRELKKVFWRWFFFGQASWNYQKFQGLGYYFSILPLLKNLYKDPEERKTVAMTHMQFFNTNNTMAPLILGVNTALEREKRIKSMEAVASLKTGMMGPLAGIGDTLFFVIPTTIIGSIASYLALEGNPIGLILWIVFGFIRLGAMRFFVWSGYQEGVRLVTEIGGRLKNLTKAANILGITVVGALIPTVVTATFGYEFQQGEVTLSIQELADQILPSLGPVLVVAVTYWMLGKKKLNSTRVVFILMALGIIAYNLKIFTT
ncbi:PTS fructose transporter subunit IID [Oceanobacillus oncorhynchi subsp. incaldanensis]|uniref:PTS system mannose/fructose/sorbose family transporter subunit IID n=1 Tax=Oceanobacillus oncorhynchi TaxID=545501 RepID=UPI001B190A06|nr:PTS system mannose/fructose/sorbose family transporter subunit IID [Oceanobacillus oncorhynchi]GIO19217.1 PTS fructose transporter subunit IID [Oceanobacillus oncorhynchi subsp. incaldanensis]